VRFTNAYVAHPVCSPTRASLLTGRYPARLHLTAYIPGQECPHAKLKHPENWIKYLRTEERTYAEAFRDAGYATVHAGKWHVGTELGPAAHGFDAVVPERGRRSMDDPWHVDFYTRQTEAFIEANAGRPFLAVLSHGTVHVPLYEREERIAKYRSKPAGPNGQNNPVMAAMIESMDRSVGRILATLKRLDLDRNTAVVFFSDNGGLSQVQDETTKKSVVATSNRPYRGGKSQLNEGGIRVPLIVKWPGVTKPGGVCRVPVISTDLPPTFLEICGLPAMPEQHLDGLGLASLLRGAATLDRTSLYWHYPHYQTLPPHGAVRSGDWKLIEHYEDGRTELFNLAVDPGEQEEQCGSRPALARSMHSMLRRHLEAIGAQMPTPNPAHDPSVHWRSGAHNGAFDAANERDQAADPRRYIVDPSRDYGRTWIPSPAPDDGIRGASVP
jgi:arylsulfatase A-like enzyme